MGIKVNLREVDCHPVVRWIFLVFVKLVIQIPCFNEEKTLPAVLSSLPKEIPRVECIETVVIDDGSQDRTAEVARAFGANYVIRLPRHRGLASAFRAGILKGLEVGADVLVNTDGDGQYNGRDIVRLIGPIIEGTADMVIGERPIYEDGNSSLSKKILYRVGSFFVSRISGIPVRDPRSGFRAFSRRFLKQMLILGDYTYTLETIVQAGCDEFRVCSIPIAVNGTSRRSRLIRNTAEDILFCAGSLIRASWAHRRISWTSKASSPISA